MKSFIILWIIDLSMSQSEVQELDEIRKKTDLSGFTECTIVGAGFNWRPVNKKTILSIDSIEFSSRTKHLINEDKKCVRDNIDENISQIIKEHNSEGYDWDMLYELAIELPNNRNGLVSIQMSETSGQLGMDSLENINSIDKIEIKDVDSKNNVKIRINDIEYEKNVLFVDTTEQDSTYIYEYNELKNARTQTGIEHAQDNWLKTRINNFNIENGTIELSCELFPNVKWAFDKPHTWSKENEFVNFVEEFGITEIEDIEGKEVYVSIDSSCSSDISKSDNTDTVYLLTDWDGITQNKAEKDSNQDSSNNLLNKIQEIVVASAVFMFVSSVFLFHIGSIFYAALLLSMVYFIIGGLSLSIIHKKSNTV